MTLQKSGVPISIEDIRTEYGTPKGSLRDLSALAGLSTPDPMSEFYGKQAFPSTRIFVYETGEKDDQEACDFVYAGNLQDYYEFYFDTRDGLQLNTPLFEDTDRVKSVGGQSGEFWILGDNDGANDTLDDQPYQMIQINSAGKVMEGIHTCPIPEVPLDDLEEGLDF